MKPILIVLGLLVVLVAAVAGAYFAMRPHAPSAPQGTSADTSAALPQNLHVFSTSTDASSDTAIAPPDAAPGTQVPPGTYSNVVLGLGDTGQFYGTLALTPVRIVSDSRCPAGVYCIQAGTVTLALDATVRGVVTHQTLSLGQSVVLGGHTVTFKAVAPFKPQGGQIEPSSYALTFSVE